MRVSIVATGIDVNENILAKPLENFASININNEIYKDDFKKSELDTSTSILEQNTPAEEMIEKSYDQDYEVSYSNNNLQEEKKIDDEIKPIDLEENIAEDKLEENKVSESQNLAETNDIEDNSLHINEAENMVETSVRRLSLFDTLNADNNLDESESDNKLNIEKSEPILNKLDEKIDNTNIGEVSDENTNLEDFSPEDSVTSEENEEFNQETEEELLDIPTFLRRQAN